MIVEEKGKNKKSPKAINSDIPKVNEPLISPLPSINIPPSFLQRLKNKDDKAKFKKFLEKFRTL